MIHQPKPVSASDSLADWMTGPIITVSKQREEKTVWNREVGLKKGEVDSDRMEEKQQCKLKPGLDVKVETLLKFYQEKDGARTQRQRASRAVQLCVG